MSAFDIAFFGSVPLMSGQPVKCAITSEAAATVYDAFSVTITFSRAVVDFTAAAQITVANGTAGDPVDSGDGITYTATITPAARATVSVSVAAGVCEDADGNPNSASNTLTRTAGLILLSADLLYLFDPASAYVYADAELTTPAANGGAVRGLKDRSTNAYHLTQAGVAGLCPTYRDSVAVFGNRPALEFDGGDYLSKTGLSSILGNLTTYSLYVVFASTNGVDKTMMSEGNSGNDTPWLSVLYAGSAGKMRPFHVGDGGAYSAPLDPSTFNNNGIVKVLSFRRNGNNFSSYINNWTGVVASTTDPGTTTLDQLCLGGLLRIAFASGYIGQIALVAAYSADNYATIEPILQAYFGMDSTYYPGASHFFCVGDSKTLGVNDGDRHELGGFGYPALLGEGLTTITGVKWRELRPRAGHDGYRVSHVTSVIAADLAAATGTAPAHVLLNLGTNDAAALPAEETWKADYATIIEAIHAKWTSAKIYLAKPVRLNAAPPSTPVAACATMSDLPMPGAPVIRIGRRALKALEPTWCRRRPRFVSPKQPTSAPSGRGQAGSARCR